MMECALKLNALVFDEIVFKRLEMHSENELEVTFSISIGTNIAKSVELPTGARFQNRLRRISYDKF